MSTLNALCPSCSPRPEAVEVGKVTSPAIYHTCPDGKLTAGDSSFCSRIRPHGQAKERVEAFVKNLDSENGGCVDSHVKQYLQCVLLGLELGREAVHAHEGSYELGGLCYRQEATLAIQELIDSLRP